MYLKYQSPLDISVSPKVVMDSYKTEYDHNKQQSYSSFIEKGTIKSILAASTTQTYRTNGTPYDNDND